MKESIAIVFLLIVSVLFVAMDRGHAQVTDLQGGIFFAPNTTRTVTVSRNGEPLVSLNVPKGAFLSVSYDDRQPHVITDGYFEFHGDVAVRIQPPSAAPRLHPGKTLAQVMREAPLVLTGAGMDVVIRSSP
jgi:hypothetical protein